MAPPSKSRTALEQLPSAKITHMPTLITPACPLSRFSRQVDDSIHTENALLSREPVLGKLRYVMTGHVPEASPHNFHLPAITEFRDERLLPIHSVRPIPTVPELGNCVDHVQLHTHGFTAVTHRTALHAPPYGSQSFTDPKLLKQHLIPETAEMLKQVTGCKTVITEALLLRAALWTETDTMASHGGNKTEHSELEKGFPQFIGFNPEHGGASPASKIHLDYSPKGARAHIRNFHPDTTQAAADIIHHEDSILAAGNNLKDCYKDCGGPRWALYSIWRPLKTVRRDPLAVLDFRTANEDDYVPADVKFPNLGRLGPIEIHFAECFLAKYSAAHKWYWIDKQTSEEVLVLRFFDSDTEGNDGPTAGGVLHSSVELPGTEAEEARESLEIRCLCIW